MSRAELQCDHDHENESGESSLKKCEWSSPSVYGATFDSPTDLRMLSHFTSSTPDRRSYKVTSDLLSKAYRRVWDVTMHVSGQVYLTTHLNLKVDLFACAFFFIFSTIDIHLDAV